MNENTAIELLKKAKDLCFPNKDNRMCAYDKVSTDEILPLIIKIIALLSKPCRWGLYDEDENTYDTDCGNIYQITNGTPFENKMSYCCYCGRKIELEIKGELIPCPKCKPAELKDENHKYKAHFQLLLKAMKATPNAHLTDWKEVIEDLLNKDGANGL